MSADASPRKVVELRAPDVSDRAAPAEQPAEVPAPEAPRVPLPMPPAPVPPAASRPKPPAAVEKPRRKWRRYVLMLVVPLLLAAVGGYMWATGGRFVSTEDSYVRRDKVTVTANVAGQIVKVTVGENQPVKKGDILLQIDPEPYRILLEQADAAVAAARLQVEQLKAAYHQAEAAVKAAQDQLTFQQANFKRQQDLLAKGVTARATFEQAQTNLQSAQQTLAQAEQSLEGAGAAIGGDPTIATDRHPSVMAALARRDQAALDLKNTEVVGSPGTELEFAL